MSSFVEFGRVRPTINRILTGLTALHPGEDCAELEKSSATGKSAIQFKGEPQG
ncbi:MAG: hypothetical protein K2X53_05685 [Alphaproteobacteria bacterium]|nr:hypothetical protein [Alphaproteobacteria bacterium]